jgi:hypothetical protein
VKLSSNSLTIKESPVQRVVYLARDSFQPHSTAGVVSAKRVILFVRLYSAFQAS